ncbi:MAG: hypothetical protein M1536_07060 [Firmicutes bacterium]|nr:hypothetical protein [Bacillota bacterium]
MNNNEMKIEEAGVVLHLEIEVSEENRSKFFNFCKKAFPVYESTGGNKMMLYEVESKSGHFNEVGYYRSLEDYKRSEYAIEHDPVQVSLIKEWLTLLEKPPEVTIYIKRPV